MLIDDLRLAFHRRYLPYQKHPGRFDPRIRQDTVDRLGRLDEALVFKVENVVSYLERAGISTVGYDEFPCVAPLSPVMWFEYRLSGYGPPLDNQPWGILVIATEITFGDAEEAARLKQDFYRGRDRNTPLVEPRWLLSVSEYMFDKAASPVPMCIPARYEVVVDAQGALSDGFCMLAADGVSRHAAEALQKSLQWDTAVCCAALSFAHCKNVAQEIHIPDPGVQRMQHAMNKPPRVTYRTLVIDAGHEVVKREQQRVASGEITPRSLHIVRGHFAEYTADKPLFGNPKNVGRFFIPMHTRGSLKAGAVVKDYEVAHA